MGFVGVVTSEDLAEFDGGGGGGGGGGGVGGVDNCLESNGRIGGGEGDGVGIDEDELDFNVLKRCWEGKDL